MSTQPDPAPAPGEPTQSTMAGGPVPLIPLGRPQLAAAARLAEHAMLHPVRLAGAGLRLTGELADVARGATKRTPAKGDRRFADSAFTEHPVYRRVLQAYLAAADVADDTVGRLGMDPKSEERARFVVNQLTDALAPTNSLAGNPAALRKAAATWGGSLLTGAAHFADDLLHNGAMPSPVDSRPFRLGENIATTPGSVVFRNDVLELILYQPATASVRTRPVLFVPPEISRYYLLDLAPGRSLIEPWWARATRSS